MDFLSHLIFTLAYEFRKQLILDLQFSIGLIPCPEVLKVLPQPVNTVHYGFGYFVVVHPPLITLFVLLFVALKGILGDFYQNRLVLPQFLTDLCHSVRQFSDDGL